MTLHSFRIFEMLTSAWRARVREQIPSNKKLNIKGKVSVKIEIGMFADIGRLLIRLSTSHCFVVDLYCC